jgi:replicative DNA helicase
LNTQVVFEAESYVLGSILLEPDLIYECQLQPEEFQSEQHRLIMKYFRFLQEHDKPIKLLVMGETSGENLHKIGGFEYLVQLTQSVPSTTDFELYQSVVRKAYIKRRTAKTLKDFASFAEEGSTDAHEVIGTVQSAVEDLAELANSNSGDVMKMSDVLKGHDKKLRKRREQRGVTGAKTASQGLDRMTGGHQDGDLEIVAARPSMGKTAYMVCDMIETSSAGRPAVLFSLEMPAEKIAERAISVLGNIDNTKLRTGMLGDLDWERWSYATEALERLPIYIDDTPGITLQQIGAKVKRLKKKHPRLVVYVDFLQLVNPGRKVNKDHEGVALVSKGLKQIARKNECPVVAISAVGRDCEKRVDKRPMMSDLRESGSIESDADIIVFLYRDDYYNANSNKKNIVELIVAKGRNVGTGTIEMLFHKTTGKFLNIDRKATEKGGGNGGQDRK